MSDITIHYVKVREIEYKLRDDGDEHEQACVILGNDEVWLEDAMYAEDDYFDGHIDDSAFSCYLVKILDDDLVAIAFVSC